MQERGWQATCRANSGMIGALRRADDWAGILNVRCYTRRGLYTCIFFHTHPGCTLLVNGTVRYVTVRFIVIPCGRARTSAAVPRFVCVFLCAALWVLGRVLFIVRIYCRPASKPPPPPPHVFGLKGKILAYIFVLSSTDSTCAQCTHSGTTRLRSVGVFVARQGTTNAYFCFGGSSWFELFAASRRALM